MITNVNHTTNLSIILHNHSIKTVFVNLTRINIIYLQGKKKKEIMVIEFCLCNSFAVDF